MINRLFLLLALLLCACAAAPSPTPAEKSAGGVPWPAHDWQTSTPAQQAMDPAVLDKMTAEIQASGPALDSLLVVRNGYIVYERYYGATTARTKHLEYSVTKSVISSLVGIAFDQGKLKDVNARLLDLFPGQTFAAVDARKQAITVENLLTMTSGLGWEENDASFGSLYRSPDWAQYLLDLPMTAVPGKQFYYCSGCSHLLSAVVRQATGANPRDFADRYLFGPLGITDYEWETDRAGLPIGGWGLSLTARDMAKLGYLYLHNGLWDGKEVISANWVEAATVRRQSTGGRLGYGYQWWTYDSHNAYAALGKYGQTIFVIPDLNIVVVTTAARLPNHDAIFHLIDTYIIPAAR